MTGDVITGDELFAHMLRLIADAGWSSASRTPTILEDLARLRAELGALREAATEPGSSPTGENRCGWRSGPACAAAPVTTRPARDRQLSKSARRNTAAGNAVDAQTAPSTPARSTRPPSGQLPSHILDPARLAAVRRTGLLDTGPEEAFDRLTRLAATLLGTPYAFVTVVDETRSFWKSCIGVSSTDPAERQNAVGDSFCQYVIGMDAELIVGDAEADPRTRDNPSIELMGVHAWAGFRSGLHASTAPPLPARNHVLPFQG